MDVDVLRKTLVVKYDPSIDQYIVDGDSKKVVLGFSGDRSFMWINGDWADAENPDMLIEILNNKPYYEPALLYETDGDLEPLEGEALVIALDCLPTVRWPASLEDVRRAVKELADEYFDSFRSGS